MFRFFSVIDSQLVGAALVTILLMGGCDPQPLDLAGDRDSYSMYGLLDPAQDTQWVRIESIPEPTTGGASAPLDVRVMLENLDTGQTWTLHDSLMIVQTEPHHNFWTTAPIKPGTSYRLDVRNDGEIITWAETTTPARQPKITPESRARGGTVVVTDIDKLAALKMRYFTPFGFVDVSYYDHEFTRKTPDGYETFISVSDDLDSLNIRKLDSLKVIAAAGGPDWPEWKRYRDATIRDLAVPGSFSNVNGGKGIVGGIYRATDGSDG
jgi:hypothetical protein